VWEWRMYGNEAVMVLSLGERAQFVFDTKSISTWYFTTIINAYMNTTEESCFSHDLCILRTLYGHVASQWIHSTWCLLFPPFRSSAMERALGILSSAHGLASSDSVLKAKVTIKIHRSTASLFYSIGCSVLPPPPPPPSPYLLSIY